MAPKITRIGEWRSRGPTQAELEALGLTEIPEPRLTQDDGSRYFPWARRRAGRSNVYEERQAPGLGKDDVVFRFCVACDEEVPWVVDTWISIYPDGHDGCWSGASNHEPCGPRLQHLDRDYPPKEKP